MFNKNFLFKSGLTIGYTILILIVLYFIFRGSVLGWAINKAETRLKTDFGLELKIKDSGFKGIAGLYLTQVKLAQAGQEPIFEADFIKIEPDISSLLTGEIKIKSFYLSDSRVSLLCNKKLCNYSSLLNYNENSADTVEDVKANPKKNYAVMLNKLFRRAFNFAPQSAEIKNFQVEFINDSIREHISIPVYHADKNTISGELQDKITGNKWKWDGSFSQSEEKFNVTFYSLNPGGQSLPLLKSFFQIDCHLDTLQIALRDLKYSNGLLEIDGYFATKNLSLFHNRISQDTVSISSLVFDSKFIVSSDALMLDSSSTFTLNSIKVKPYLRLKVSDSKVIDIRIDTDPTEVTDFFYSLPQGMFEEVRDVEGEGLLEYSLVFHFDTSSPDSLIFDSELKKSRFHLTKFGDGNLLKIRGPFMHSVYENDRLYRNFEVGPGNPAYTPIDSISSLFQSAVLTSEDGNFYFHNGFNEDAFRKSIATNYKAGRFQRGGSTISMQLVKNVYLTRNKTIARKAEEALIVWLLESNRLVSKSRLLEVYMNIIELGPGIYGIGEAAPFYFDKRPSQLNLAESIFLASLLPHPKWYKSSFDESGRLKPNQADYYRVVSNFMLRKNLITQQQYDELKPEVELKGPAREKIVRMDSILIMLPEPEEN